MHAGRRRGFRRCAAIGLGAVLAVGAAACSSLPRIGGVGGGAGREIRPDAGPEFDVLVAEEHQRAGRAEQALAAWQRALAKDEGSAYLHRRVAEGLIAARDFEAARDHAERALALDPADTESRLLLANLSRALGDAAAAERALLGADGKPADRNAALLLHQVYLESGRAEDSLRIAESLAAEDPFALDALLAQAASQQRLGNAAEAERLLRRAIELEPRNLRLRGLLAHHLRERGDHDGAIAVYRELLALDPHQSAALSALADTFVEKEDIEGAIRAFEELALHHPEDQRVRLRLGLLYFQQERFADAVAELVAFAAEQEQLAPEIRFVLASAKRRAGDDAGAAADFEAIPASHRSYADARLELAAIHERARDYARALAEVERVRELRPLPGLELYAATLLAKSGDVDGAIARVRELQQSEPDSAELHYSLGLIQAEGGKSDAALASMQRALELDPNHASALNYVGYTWAERGQRLDEAERMIVRALELRPGDGYITDSLGWVYFMRARAARAAGRAAEAQRYVAQAREQLLRAEELTGGDPVISEHLGDVDLFEGKRAEALRRYEESVAKGPRSNEQPELQQKLDRLRRELR